MHGQLNVSSNIVRSHQTLTLVAVAFVIAFETINKSLYETDSTVCSCGRTHFLAFFSLAIGMQSCGIFVTACATVKKY